jgi:predicted AAA+ superfamily ATPase
VAAQATESRAGHLRTRNGDYEVDLVVEGPDGQLVGIEVKLAAGVTDADVRHLHWLRNQLSDDTVDLLVITTGSNAYRRRDGIAVIPLALLGA